jgi:hypothetical protein
LLLLNIFKVEVLEILWQLTFYVMIDKPEINNTTRINEAEIQYVSRTLSGKSHLLLLDIFKVEVLEILR